MASRSATLVPAPQRPGRPHSLLTKMRASILQSWRRQPHADVGCAGPLAVAVLRYDLYDIDRLLGSTIAWLLTSLASAAVFTALVFGATEAIGANSPLSLIGATFVAAIILLPLHRSISHVIGRLVDHERTVILARVQGFVRQVRDGEAEPEATEARWR